MKKIPDYFRLQSETVYSAHKSVIAVSKSEIDFLREVAANSSSRKSRVLLHGRPSNDLHEMLIVHSLGQYIQPHINDHSAKSFVVLEGEMVVVVYKEDGTVKNHIHLSRYDSSSAFLLRLGRPVFHTVVAISQSVTFLETVKGPHIETRYASFAPSPINCSDAKKYMAWLMREIGINN